MLRKERYMALCANRHHMAHAIDGAIYPKRINLGDTARINKTAENAVRTVKADGASLILYVSGAQYPLIAVINECIRQDVDLTLMHFNPTTQDYYSQKVETVRE